MLLAMIKCEHYMLHEFLFTCSISCHCKGYMSAVYLIVACMIQTGQHDDACMVVMLSSLGHVTILLSFVQLIMYISVSYTHLTLPTIYSV